MKVQQIFLNFPQSTYSNAFPRKFACILQAMYVIIRYISAVIVFNLAYIWES